MSNTNPLQKKVYAPLRKFITRPAMRVAVLGVGGLGHLAVQFAAAMGAEVRCAFAAAVAQWHGAAVLRSAMQCMVCRLALLVPLITFVPFLPPAGRLRHPPPPKKNRSPASRRRPRTRPSRASCPPRTG